MRAWMGPRYYVFYMNFAFALAAGVVGAMYLELGWWSLALGVAIVLALELSLVSRTTAWLSMIVGVACSGAAGFAGGVVIAASLTDARAIWWVAGAVGVIPGAWLMVDAHRRLRTAPS